METLSRLDRGSEPGRSLADSVPAGIPTIESVSLLKGARELLIRHGANTYRLRVTASEKLILTK